MRLAPLYQQDREQAFKKGEETGIQQGERLVVENLLKVRFGEIDNELQAIIESLLALTPEEFTPLLLQLSREELIARFRQ
jgi:flagellar biosynthesis/type III secretory pathway protein FliH